MYKLLDTFLLRTPYFPFSALSDFEKQQHELVFKEMLQIASPDLSEMIEKGENRALYSAYRYYQRACTRPMPFGLFAGCSVGSVGERTEILLTEQQKYKRVTRLDMHYICALTQQIEKDKDIREQLHYYSNSSLYPAGNHLRYVEYFFQNTRRVHQIAQLENSKYLQKILDIGGKGARFTELVATLMENEITIEEATEFIHELIDAQVLVSELEPAITNVQPLTILISKLKCLQNVNRQFIGILSEIEEQLLAIDQQPIGNTRDYPAIIKNIDKIKVENEVKYLFQTDMFKPVQHATISRNIVKEIEQALLVLNKLSSSVSITNLSQFKENFIKRYDDREIPLLFALDTELGIGYAHNTSGDFNPLVDDLSLPVRNTPTNVTISSPQTVLLKKYLQAMEKGENIVELTDEDMKSVEAIWDDLLPTFSVICQILRNDDSKHSIFIQFMGWSSAANLLGRFCHLDEQIFKHTLSITEKEVKMNPGVIFAEIVHLPESRLGNVLLRPVLRPYEITYLAKPGVSKEFKIGPDDLYISVKNNRIVLRSKKLNKEIVPRMSTAHNYSGNNSMPVYHFLCDMQHQDRRVNLGFQWNAAVQQLGYIPRVIYKNCILSLARWTVRKKEIKTFVGIKNDDELLLKVKEWREGRNIPDKVLLVDGDNELFVDMKNPLSIRAWLSVIKERLSFWMDEFLFDPATAVVHGPEGVFTNEFIFAFCRDTITKQK
jgi:hypothetical protein